MLFTGVISLAGGLPAAAGLTSLDLSSTCCGAPGAGALVAAVQQLPSLTHLLLAHNSGLGDAGVQALAGSWTGRGEGEQTAAEGGEMGGVQGGHGVTTAGGEGTTAAAAGAAAGGGGGGIAAPAGEGAGGERPTGATRGAAAGGVAGGSKGGRRGICLDLSACGVGAAGVAVLAGAPGLSQLNLMGCDLGDAGEGTGGKQGFRLRGLGDVVQGGQAPNLR